MIPPHIGIPKFQLAYLTIWLTLFVASDAKAAEVNIIGNWHVTVGLSDLVMGAGTDFHPTFETSTTGATIGITNTNGAPWTLWVRRDASTLPAAVSIAVRRTSNGTGNGSIGGGTDYVVVTDYEQILFQGVGDRSGVGQQLRLAGISIKQGPGEHGCNLIYRIE